jgi:2-oxo-3-hexenedioate decarboxylase
LPTVTNALARELMAAYSDRITIEVPPTGRDPEFDLAAGYAVEAELARLRRAAGHPTVGRKVGFGNRALWRKLKLETVLWAHMYDDTVRFADGDASLGVGHMVSPKIEPEIIFKLRQVPSGDLSDPVVVLESVEWLALGFEIVDCVYRDWKFQPPDFVAAFGLHAGLVVGPPSPVTTANIPALAQRLSSAKARLFRDGAQVSEGWGANVLGSPAVCLGELARGIALLPSADLLVAGELISTGALTENQFIAPGESWSVSVEGLDLPDITLHTTA